MPRGYAYLLPFILIVLATEVLLAARVRAAEVEPATGADPVRVASLLPWVSHAIDVAGPRATLVAGVRRDLHTPLPDGRIDLGNPHSPDLEGLALARPDLVVADAAVHARLAEPIEKLGVRLLLLETSTVAGTLEALEALSRAVGGSAAIDARVAAIRARLQSLEGRAQASIVALFGAPGSFYIMTERAWLGDLARYLGFELAIASSSNERFPGLVPVSDEALAMAHPDLVVLVAHGDPARIRAELERRTASGGAWAGLSGATLGLHVLDPQLFSANPGLDLVRAAETLIGLGAPRTSAAERATEPLADRAAGRSGRRVGVLR